MTDTDLLADLIGDDSWEAHDDHVPCIDCNEEHPFGVLEDGLCPSCCDEFEK